MLPPWARVQTMERHAPVRVDQVDPHARLVAFDKHGHRFRRRFGAVQARRIRRGMRGRLVTVTTTVGHKASVPAHRRLLCRWNAQPGWGLYLMRSTDDLWRVGMTVLHPDSNGYEFGPARRATDEHAAALWLLDVFADRRDAGQAEREASSGHGITQRQFKRERFAIKLGLSDPAKADPAGLLAAYGRDVDHPLWVAGERAQRGCRATMELAATNLVPGWMDVVVDAGVPEPRWLGFTTTARNYNGHVYGIRLDRHAHLAADGLVVRHDG